jgi:hypothetical protein
MEYIEVKKIINGYKSKGDVLKALGLSTNGRNYKKLNNVISEYKIDISHFDGGASKRVKHTRIEKECPICNSKFKVIDGGYDDKITCSHACSNTYFRSGEDNGNWKDISEYYHNLRHPRLSKKYREICFNNHKHECVVCGEDKILDVHHYDSDRTNNNPNNLIPLCPTHHGYVHYGYEHLVIDRINEYVKKLGARAEG